MEAITEFNKTELRIILKTYMRFEKRCAQATKAGDYGLANAMRAGHNLAGWKIKGYLDAFPTETRKTAAEIGLDIA